MYSFPSSRHGSVDNIESMTEILHGKYFPLADSCPLQIDVNHIPMMEDSSRRSSSKRKSTGSRATEKIVLPAIRTQSFAESSSAYMQMDTEQELQDLDSSYRPSGSKAKSLSKSFNFTGPSACQTNFDSFLQQSLEVVLERRDEKLVESNALKRWEFWMKDKRRTQEYLGRRLQKSPEDLLIQDSDKIRRKLEDRWLSTCTRIPQPDKWRGHPFRWKAEFRLPNRKIRWNEPKVGSPPEYCAIRTSLDQGVIPDTEFIGIPRTIQKEKGFVYKRSIEKPCESIHAEDTYYFMSRRRQLKPHDIDMDALEVIGKKIGLEPKEVPEQKSSRKKTDLPDITIDDMTDYEKTDDDTSLFCLVIGDVEIKYNITNPEYKIPCRPFHWNVDFALNTVGALAERVLRVENRGTVAIRYHWLSEKPQKEMNLEKLQPRQYEPWFFFNKNSGFFLPGQIYHLKFYHHSKFSGIRKEVWHLQTDPPLSLSTDPCTVTLSAIATEEISSRNPLEKYLFNRVKMSIVENMIDVMLDRVLRPFSVRGIEYRSLFSNKILFEYNNPKRYYNSTIVSGLNKLYEEITPGLADWDLSLDTLVCQVKARRIGKERNSILLHVAEKASLLLKPTYVAVREDTKYRMTYGILCKMINFMEDDYHFFRITASPKATPVLKRPQDISEENSTSSIDAGECGEFDYFNATDLEINPVNLFFLKTMLYIKVYYRLCQAVEHVVGVLETRKLFEPWKEINYRVGKPTRRNGDLPYTPNFTEL